MTKIQDVHPTLAHSMDITVQLLRSGILYRQREIADMEAAIKACQVVRSEEASHRLSEEPADLASISERMEAAIAKELENPPAITGTPVQTRKIAAFRAAAREGAEPA